MPKFQNFKATVIERKDLAENIRFLSVKPEQEIDFLGGQYFSFRVAEKINRAYSTASAPGEGKIDFVVDLAPGGPGSQFIGKLQVGEEFNILGPVGFFNLKQTKALEDDEEIIFIATGTGIAPIRSLILDLLKNYKTSRILKLYFGMRFENETYYFDEFEALEKEYLNFKFIPVISRPTENWKGKTGHVQSQIISESINSSARVYICGRTETVKSIAQDLLDYGYSKEKVFFEKFG